MTVVRWTFTDTVTSETVTLPFNPNKMTSFFTDNATATAATSPIDGLVRARRVKSPPKDASFGGFIRSSTQHDLMLDWGGRSSLMVVTDHLGRSWHMRFVSCEMIERKPTALKPWKFEYTMRCLTYGKV